MTATGTSSLERKVPMPHLWSTLAAWILFLVSTYLFGSSKNSIGTFYDSNVQHQVLQAVASVTKRRTFFVRFFPALAKKKHTSGGNSRDSAN
jgi:hypothetical protein